MKKRNMLLIAFVSILVILCFACASTRSFQLGAGENPYAIKATVPDFSKWAKEEVLFYPGENFEVICWVYTNPANDDEALFILIGKEKEKDQWKMFILSFVHLPSFAAWNKDNSCASYYNDERYIDDGVPSFSLVLAKKQISPERFKKLVKMKEAKKPSI